MRNAQTRRGNTVLVAKFLEVIVACNDIVDIYICIIGWAASGLESCFDRGRLNRVIARGLFDSYSSQYLARLGQVEGASHT